MLKQFHNSRVHCFFFVMSQPQRMLMAPSQEYTTDSEGEAVMGAALQGQAAAMGAPVRLFGVAPIHAEVAPVLAPQLALPAVAHGAPPSLAPANGLVGAHDTYDISFVLFLIPCPWSSLLLFMWSWPLLLLRVLSVVMVVIVYLQVGPTAPTADAAPAPKRHRIVGKQGDRAAVARFAQLATAEEFAHPMVSFLDHGVKKNTCIGRTGAAQTPCMCSQTHSQGNSPLTIYSRCMRKLILTTRTPRAAYWRLVLSPVRHTE